MVAKRRLTGTGHSARAFVLALAACASFRKKFWAYAQIRFCEAEDKSNRCHPEPDARRPGERLRM